MKDKLLILGDQAVALGALYVQDFGRVRLSRHTFHRNHRTHPKFSSAGAGEYIAIGANEKTAVEAALGSPSSVKRALVCMKHVGLNVAADAFIRIPAMTGTHGRVGRAVADDPSMHSLAERTGLPFLRQIRHGPHFRTFVPAGGLRYGTRCFDLSERVKLPVLMRLTTRMAHSRAVVVPAVPRDENPLSFPEDRACWVLLPVNARRRYNELLAVQRFAAAFRRIALQQLPAGRPPGGDRLRYCF